MCRLFEFLEERRMDYLEKDFEITEIVPDKDLPKHRHVIKRGIFQDSDAVWFIKEMNNPVSAKIELVSQEFFRFIRQLLQPETRLRMNMQNVNYLLSEEVKGFHPFVSLKDAVWSYEYPGIGEIILIAMFLQENDLKNGNIGLNSANEAVKVDGDKSFWNLISNKSDFNPITPEMLTFLPFPKGFSPFNWINIFKEGKQVIHDPCIEDMQTIQGETSFGLEMNQAILKITMLPEALLSCFVDTYIPSGASRVIELLIQRSNELKSSALQLTSFRNFLCSPTAIDIIRDHIDHLLNFVVNKKGYLVVLEKQPEMHVTLIHRVFQLYESVLSDLPIEKEQLANRLFEMRDMGASKEDTVLAKTLLEMLQQVIGAESMSELASLDRKIDEAYQALMSDQYLAVKNVVQKFRAEKLSIRTQEKAVRIEQALCDLPVSLRGMVVSGPLNPVQLALAWHRHPGRSQNVFFKNNPDEIDPKKAAKSYGKLYETFKDEGRMLMCL